MNAEFTPKNGEHKNCLLSNSLLIREKGWRSGERTRPPSMCLVSNLALTY